MSVVKPNKNNHLTLTGLSSILSVGKFFLSLFKILVINLQVILHLSPHLFQKFIFLGFPLTKTVERRRAGEFIHRLPHGC